MGMLLRRRDPSLQANVGAISYNCRQKEYLARGLVAP